MGESNPTDNWLRLTSHVFIISKSDNNAMIGIRDTKVNKKLVLSKENIKVQNIKSIFSIDTQLWFENN